MKSLVGREDQSMLETLKQSVAEAIERNRCRGQYAVIWRDGKARLHPDRSNAMKPNSWSSWPGSRRVDKRSVSTLRVGRTTGAGGCALLIHPTGETAIGAGGCATLIHPTECWTVRNMRWWLDKRGASTNPPNLITRRVDLPLHPNGIISAIHVPESFLCKRRRS